MDAIWPILPATGEPSQPLEFATADRELRDPRPLERQIPRVLTHPIHKYSFPWGQCAAISLLFSSAGVAHCLWGDPVLTYHKCNQGMLTVVVLIQDTDLNKATELLISAGLPHCTCTSWRHLADPKRPDFLPTHFQSGPEFIHLCTASILLDQIPLTADHPNPLGLSFDRYLVPLVVGPSDSCPQTFERATEATDDNHEDPQTHQVVRFLDPRSVVLFHLHMAHCWQSGITKQDGIGLQWSYVVSLMQCVDRDRRILDSLPEGPLRDRFFKLHQRGLPTIDYEDLGHLMHN